MEENNYWREQFEIEMKIIDRLEGDPYKHGLLCALINCYSGWEENSYKQKLIERVEKLRDKRDDKPYWHELIERARNFHGSDESFIQKAKENETFFANLQWLCMQLEVDIDKVRGLDQKQILKMLFKRVYKFIIMNNENFKLFEEDSPLFDNVLDACFFTSLCMYLHDSKHIEAMSLNKFVYRNSPNLYNEKDSKSYFDYDYPEKDSFGYTHIDKEEDTLRQMRHRRLKNRVVYNKKTEWKAIRKDSEYEWSIYYLLDVVDENIRKTLKDISNLYNGIYKAIDSPKDEGYQERLDDAYKKFLSKLRKLEYEKFLKLQKELLEHLCENEQHYGMNIYRLERQLKLYNITYEVNRLIECNDEVEEIDLLEKSVILNNIYFPKVYQDFSDMGDYNVMRHCVRLFSDFMNIIWGSCRLVIDEFVEKGAFGEDWEKLFLDTINDMTENVFYSLDEIDFTVKPELQEASQKAFVDILSAPVNKMLDRYRSLNIPIDDEV